MSGPPSKRRKMRPNNPISKEKQSNLVNKENQTKEKQADTTSAEVKSPTKNTPAKSAKVAQVNSENKATEIKKKTSKTKAEEKTKCERKRKTTHESEITKPLTTTPATKVYESASDSDETDKEEIAKQTHKTDPKVESKPKIKATPKASLKANPKPTAKGYESASDSDETDKEEAVKPTHKTDPKVESKPKIKATPKASLKANPKPTAKGYESASDSDETDKEEAVKPTRKTDPKVESKPKIKATPKASLKANPKPTAKGYESASDSDETDKEEAVKPTRKTERKRKSDMAKKVKKNTAMTEPKNTVNALDTEMSDADTEEDSMEEDTEVEKTKNQESTNVHKTVGGKAVNDSESESESELESNHVKNNKFDAMGLYESVEFNLQKMDSAKHLRANRISFHNKKDYDQSLTPADNIRRRLNDLFVPSVKDNEFISDSESDTDSGEDYGTKEYPSWQRTLSLTHNKETDPWPKQRKFGYSDKLKLEKRIKKICKREDLSFDDARKIFSSNKRTPYIPFFQKIAKAFPNMSLHALAKQCKLMYHVKRGSSPWTPEEIAKLKELIKDHGTSPTVLSKYMERSPKNISDFMYNHMSTGKTNSKHWTSEEDKIIAKVVATLKPGESFSATELVPLFDGTRTPKQIHRRYRTIRHLIKKDGTIEPNRKATLMEELEYLNGLLKQAEDLGLKEESQLDYSKNRGFVSTRFYLNSRFTIDGFEKMDIKEILKQLIKRHERILESRRLEMALRPN